MKKGDIVLVPFPFTDLSGSKNRPALILINADLDVTVSFITTQVKWEEQYDIKLEPTLKNGIKKPSLIRLSKLTTIDKELLIGKLGELSKAEISSVNENLIELLRLK